MSMKTTKETIQQIVLGLKDIFPDTLEERRYVEDVVLEIKTYIKHNKFLVWGKELPQEKSCIGIEIVQDIFNGLEMPQGERMFYLLRDSADTSYADYYLRGSLSNPNQLASRYTFNRRQDRYFEYLMAQEGLIRQIKEGGSDPSEARWYLL